MIKGVVEAKYKADKAIVHGLLRMYFHDYFVEACEWTIFPSISQKMMLWLVKYWANFEASQLDIGKFEVNFV